MKIRFNLTAKQPVTVELRNRKEGYVVAEAELPKGGILTCDKVELFSTASGAYAEVSVGQNTRACIDASLFTIETYEPESLRVRREKGVTL